MDPPRLDGKDDDRAARAEVVIVKLHEEDPGPKDFLCVDGSLGADRAAKWAMANLPKEHRLVMVHGIYAPITGWTAESLMLEHETIESKYRPMCEAAGRKCSFFSFPYLTKGTFGDTVCKLARYNGVNSVVTGRRSDLSPIRRQFVGSQSMALLNRCEVPVTVVTDAWAEDDFFGEDRRATSEERER
jgi:nucleotide-binding universal stress UspA family protein